MTSRENGRKASAEAARAVRVGLFGLLGQGNLGNDGSMEAVLRYLRAEHPGAIVDVMCTGPEQVTQRYGLPAVRLRWYDWEDRGSERPTVVRKSLGTATGMVMDLLRTATWVRRHDVVIVPGMGVLEASLPQRPWGTPYAMFLLSASGRLFGVKVALVSVGANVIHQRLTRSLFMAAARLASYRSYRDKGSKDAMQRMGVDTSGDLVYPDLAFSLPVPEATVTLAGAVGVGIMDYSGGNDDRRQARELHSAYIEQMKRFVLWLADNGRPIRLFTTDVHDERIMREVLADLRVKRPGLDPSRAVVVPATTLDELMRQMTSVEVVVASRFHNVLCSLKLAKPTLAVGYSGKFESLMAEMGLAEFCHSARSLDAARLIEQFTKLEGLSPQLRNAIIERNAVNAELLESQFAALSVLLFSAPGPVTSQLDTNVLMQVAELKDGGPGKLDADLA